MPTDAHCHVATQEGRCFICTRPDSLRPPALPERSVEFRGFHPWDALDAMPGSLARLRAALEADCSLGVGEIGLDRLRSRDISGVMRGAFAAQLEIAADFGRPVVLHGAKCWGQVVAACRPYADRIPAFLFHGFSRSDGLLGDIAALNGFVSVGPAVLNDHAVNYRELVRKIPDDMILVETDATEENAGGVPSISEILSKTAALRGKTAAELESVVESNADRFVAALN